MVTVAIGALAGWAFSGALVAAEIVANVWGAIALGASLGSLFVTHEFDASDFASSPNYSFGPISNTMSQLVPIFVVYGKNRVAGNIIYQVFDSDKKEVQDLYILVGEGGITSINDVMANDQNPAELDGCSVTTYLDTDSTTHDSRDPSGARPYPDNVALICLTLKAQENLNGTPTITSIVEGMKVWTPGGFAYSRNPIWIILDILCHPRYGMGMGVVDSSGAYSHPNWDKIDYACAIAAANYCDGNVEYGPRFQLDFVMDTRRPIRDVLADFLSSCRGYMVQTNKLEIYIDAPVDTYSRSITPGNIVEGSFTFWQAADEGVCNRITVDWIDPDNNYERVTDVFQDSDDIAIRGVVEKSFSLLGVTRSGQVGHMGYYLLKGSMLVRNFCSFGVSFKDCDIQPGEVLTVSFEDFTGWVNKPFRVISVKDNGNDVMTVTCSEYIPEIYDDSVMEVPVHIDTSLTTNYKPDDVEDLAITEQLETLQDGSYNLIAKITWTPPESYQTLELWYRYSSEVAWVAGGTLPKGSTEYYLPCTGNIGDTLYVRVYTVSRLGVRSSGQTTSRILRGDTVPPAAPTNLQGEGGFRLAHITWTDPPDGDLDHIDVYRSFTADDADDFTKIGIAPRFAQEYIDNGLGVLQTAWYKLKAVDVAGNESVFSDVASATTEAIETDDIPDGTIGESHLAPSLIASIDRIGDIEIDIDAIDVDISGIKGDISGIKDDVANIETDVSEIQSNVEQVSKEAQERLESAKSVLSNEIKNLREYADEQLSSAAEAAIGALGMVKDVGDKLSDAGVYVDPDSGQVKIYGLEVLREETDVRLSNAEIRLDAQEAQISSKVTLTQVDERIAEAVFGDVGELIVSGINARIDEVEETLDAQAVAISEKASSTQVADHELRLTTAESDILGLDAAIALKASQLEVSELTQRVNSAELRIDAQNGTISQFVGQSKEDVDALSDASIQNAINGFDSQKRNKESLAYAKQELKANISEVNGKVEAEAAARLELGVRVDGNYSAILEEQSARASADEVLTKQIEEAVSDYQTGDSSLLAAIQSEATTRADADEALTNQIETVASAYQAGDSSLLAAIQSEAETRANKDEVLTKQIEEAVSDYQTGDSSLLAAIQSEAETRANKDEVLTKQIEEAVSDYQTGDSSLLAAIQSEATTRADADEALTNQIETVASAYQAGDSSLLAAIQSEAETRANKDEVYGNLTTALVAQLDNDAGEAAVENAIQGYENSKALSKQSAAYFKELNTRIVAGQRSEAESREVLEASLGNALAQIEQVSKVTAGKPDVYNQPSAPSGSLKLGDLWIDTNSLIHRWTGSEWEECRDKELVELMELASAQTWLKAQVSASGRKVIAGIGVLADTTTGSEITMLANRFFLISDIDGTLIQPFAVDASDPSNPKVVINGNLFVKALEDNGYTDGTGWIVGGNIAALNRIQLGDGGALVAGEGSIFQLGGDGQYILIDSEQGVIRISNTQTGEYILMDKGDLTTYKTFSGMTYPVALKSLRVLETGVAQNNVRKTLSQRFAAKPQITVGLNDVAIYAPEYQSSKQRVKCYVNDNEIYYNEATGIASFLPHCELTTEGGTTNVNLGDNALGSASIPISGKWIVFDQTYTVWDGLFQISIGITQLYISVNVYAQIGAGSDNGDAAWHRTYTIYAYLSVNGTDYLIGSVTYTKAADTFSINLMGAPEQYGTYKIQGSISIPTTENLISASVKLRVYGHGDTYGNALNGTNFPEASSAVLGNITAFTQTGVSTAIDVSGWVNYTAISE